MTVSSPSVGKDHQSPDYSPSTVQRDDGTTRYLCAAAHRWVGFAEQAIAEYLVEKVRAVAPTPGLDLAAVLRDAVAARFRCRLRNLVLLVLLAVLAVLNPLGVAFWTLGAFLLGRRLAGRRIPGWLRATVAPLAALGLVLGLGFVKVFTGVGWPWDDRSWWPSTLVGLLLLMVIAADELAVHRLLHTRFQVGRFCVDFRDAEPTWERWLRGLGQGRFADQLERIAAADEYSPQAAGRADVVVHHGPSPFIGAGWMAPTQTIALTFQPAEDRSPQPVDIAHLHAGVAAALDELRGSPSVVPGMRMDGILHREQILIHVEELVKNATSDIGTMVLPHREQPPQRHIALTEARKLAKVPERWARYYSCFRVESSNGDLVTSCYLYVGADRYGLSIKRTHCLLVPIKSALRRIDLMVNAGDGPISATGVVMLRLPVTAWRRLRTVIRRLRSPRMRRKGLPVARYGAIRSLRERVIKDDKQPPEFLLTDADLYARTVDVRLFGAITTYLKGLGYDVVQFQRDVRQTIQQNSINIQNSTFTSSIISAGDGAINVTGATEDEES